MPSATEKSPIALAPRAWAGGLLVLLGCGGPPDAPRFRVEVVGGEASCDSCPPGQTVHVWSALSASREVALPWGGDADLLAGPGEWHSTFVMPARDVRLVANSQAVSLTLTKETYFGRTSKAKVVHYHFPAAMRGVVLMSHGTGGSSEFITKDEPFALALALVHRGYGVMGTEAEEAVAGDLNGDGKERWFANAPARADNVDLGNLQALFADFEARGLIPASTPRFALGMSNGGAWSHFLGTVATSAVANDFPLLRFRAVASYCADATAARSASLSDTPSAWFMCGAEDNPEVSNAEARANSKALAQRGVATDYIEHPPSPIYGARFTRVDGVSPEASTSMVAELQAAGFVDSAGFLNRDADSIGQFVVDNPSRFPAITAQQDALVPIRSQLKSMRAEHTMYADLAGRNIAFFDRFNP